MINKVQLRDVKLEKGRERYQKLKDVFIIYHNMELLFWKGAMILYFFINEVWESSNFSQAN